MNKPDPYKVAYERERKARLLAERLLNEKTRSLYDNYIKLELTVKELKSTQQQLIQSEKMASIGQLAAGVAHEINNPIGYSISNLAMLSEYVDSLLRLDDFIITNMASLPSNDIAKAYQQLRQEEDIDYINGDIKPMLAETDKGLNRVKEIVSNLNKVSHSGSFEKELCDINELIEQSLKVAWNELKYCLTVNKNLTQLPKVYCHPGEMNQVFLNMFINAAHATKDIGVLDITTGIKQEEGKQYLTIEISDDGDGIPVNIINKIFDPFFTTKPVGIGTGLGLSISFGIIKKHEGKIKVTSDENQGTTFTIYLPCNVAFNEPC
ncbi:sensor histidine kinase [Colwellia sp. 12G3]|uniref:sensor histidine kinase n=1 Tax=Colwellia sp. 12G3 TaxID=2058299 RepID=UPI000C33F5CA|nr:ATP-binding protein [Colwellia sp. 12G3]PKI16984.1 histidine kinase [Colwellia sp. 12G3]